MILQHKTIHQLAKITRRLPRRIRGVEHKLSRKGITLAARKFLGLRLDFLTSVGQAINLDLARRNINGFAARCAIPLKKQRELNVLLSLSS